MSVEKVRIGIVGCGAIAEIYHLPAIESNPRTSGVVVLADTNAAQLKKLSEKFRVAACVEDYREMVGQVEAVIIATPPATHYAICRYFLEQKIHVLCEKPLTEIAEEAHELVELADRNGVQLCVNQTRRFFPSYHKIRELIQAGELGELQSISYHDGVEFDWPAASPHHFSPGAKGAWSDTGVHLLDTVCYWLDAKPELLASYNDSHTGPEAIATVQLRHHACDIEIKVSRLGRLKNGFEIVGSRGKIEAEAEEFSEVVLQRAGGGKRRFKCGSRKLTYVDFAKPMLEDFVASVRGEKPPRVAAKSVLATVDLLAEAYERVEPFSMPWNSPATQSAITATTVNPSQTTDLPLRVLVTGASGFLGGRLVEAMHLSAFAKPIAAIRGWSRAARVARFPVDVQLCDIMDPAQIDAALSGVDAIVHCAKSDDRESIVEGTRNLLEAASRRGVKKFVYLSSAEVYGSSVSGQVLETQATGNTGGFYGDAKAEAEQVCFDFCSRGVEASVLRPSLIYGPFSTSWSVDIAKRLQSGKWGRFDEHGDGFANLIYVDDLVQAIFLCLTSAEAAGEAFNVSGPDQLTWNQYFDAFNAVLGLDPLQSISTSKSRLRTWAMSQVDYVTDKIMSRYEDKLMEIYLRGGLASRVMKRIKGELDSTPSATELHDLYSRKAIYCDDKAREVLGYEPQFDIRRGLQLTTAWLQLHEWIPQADPQMLAPPSDGVSDTGDVSTPGNAVEELV